MTSCRISFGSYSLRREKSGVRCEPNREIVRSYALAELVNPPFHLLHSDLAILPLPFVFAGILLFAEGFVFFSKSVSWKKSGGFLLFVREVGVRDLTSEE